MFPIAMSIVISILLILLSAAVFYFKVYIKMTMKFCKSTRSLKGRVAIVTGGSAGMGFEISKEFAARGARVIIACPFEDEGDTARKTIVKETGNENVVFKFLDLASLASVRQFAADILNTEERLDILMNNAGVGIPGDFLTADGLNFIMQVNYFGHFLLTLLLLPLLRKTGTANEPSRIVNTSSELHKVTGIFDIDKLNATGYKNKIQIYGTSKLCIILSVRELAKRLKDSNVVVNSLQPGTVRTQIYDSADKPLQPFIYFGKLFLKTPWEGCQTSLYLALDDEGKVSGEFFENCTLVQARKLACNDQLATDLFDESIKLVKLTKIELEKCLKG